MCVRPLLFVLGFVGCAGFAVAQTTLPRAEPPFTAKVEGTLQGSVPEYPTAVRPAAGAPNVVVVLIDDAGFGNPSTPCARRSRSKARSSAWCSTSSDAR